MEYCVEVKSSSSHSDPAMSMTDKWFSGALGMSSCQTSVSHESINTSSATNSNEATIKSQNWPAMRPTILSESLELGYSVEKFGIEAEKRIAKESVDLRLLDGIQNDNEVHSSFIGLTKSTESAKSGPLAPEQDAITDIESRMIRYKTEITETESLVEDKLLKIQELEDAHGEASDDSKSKTAEIKEMDAQRKVLNKKLRELNQKIKDAKSQKSKLSVKANEIEASIGIVYQSVGEAKTTLKHLQGRFKELTEELHTAKQHQSLKEEFPDEGLRTIAGAIRGIPKFQAIKKERHSPETESDDDNSDNDVEIVHERWRSLDLGQATVTDFQILHNDIETIDRQIKRESVIPVIKREDGSSVRDEDEESEGGFTTETMKRHLAAVRYHSQQVQSFMARLRGTGDRKRGLDQIKDEEDVKDLVDIDLDSWKRGKRRRV